MKITPQQIVKNLRTWARALRSGKYKQTTYRLRGGDAYCCLGVAHVVLTGKQPSNASVQYDRVSSLCGFRRGDRGTFARLNDRVHMPFVGIAKHVDKLADQKAAALKKPKVRK